MGYRYYDRQNTPAPLFPFGFGLGYETDFRVSHLRLLDPSSLSLGSDPEGLIRYTCSVKNHGTRSGATVLQYYLSIPHSNTNSGRDRPLKELKELQKLVLQPGEEKEVVVSLDKYAVSHYNVREKCWQVDAARYMFSVGLSAEHIFQVMEFELEKGFQWTGI